MLCFRDLFVLICCIFSFWLLFLWSMLFPLTLRWLIASVAGSTARMHPVGRKHIGAPWFWDKSLCRWLWAQDFCSQRCQWGWCTFLQDCRTSDYCLLWARAEDRPWECHNDRSGVYNDPGGTTGYNTRVIAAGSKRLGALHIAWVETPSCIPLLTEGHLAEKVANLQHIRDHRHVSQSICNPHPAFRPANPCTLGGTPALLSCYPCREGEACATAGDMLWWRRRCNQIRVQLRCFSYRGCADNVDAVAEAMWACDFMKWSSQVSTGLSPCSTHPITLSPSHPASTIPKRTLRPLSLTNLHPILSLLSIAHGPFLPLPRCSTSSHSPSYRSCLSSHQGQLERYCSCGQWLQHSHCWCHKATGHTGMGILYACIGEWPCPGLFVCLGDRECPVLVRVIMHNRIPMPLMRLCWALYQCRERFVQTNKSMSGRTGRNKHYPSCASCRLLCRRWKDPILVLFSIASPWDPRKILPPGTSRWFSETICGRAKNVIEIFGAYLFA